MTVSIDDQVECVKRELHMRHKVYSWRIKKGQMTQEFADKQILHMQAVLMTLYEIQKKGRLL